MQGDCSVSNGLKLNISKCTVLDIATQQKIQSLDHRSLLPIILSVFYYCYPAYGSSLSREDTGRILKAAHLLPIYLSMVTCCMVNKVLSLKEPQYLSERLPGKRLLNDAFVSVKY
ncbi:hypothetical protein J6590_089202 [Homalodisca vitripennis]|nr:hypothetical protein J6590_089202 [Homalodisca vitripennis]